jgi:hypothetical protein
VVLSTLVPFRYIGQRLDVRLTDAMVFIYADAELVKSHVRVSKGRRLNRLAGLSRRQGSLLHAHPSLVSQACR